MASVAACVGFNGSGKSLAMMIFHVAPALESGRPVYSTVAIDHPLYRPIESWRDILSIRDALVVLDDISAQFPSRGAMAVPPQLMVKLNTLRHDNVQLVWSGPDWARADKALREVTQEVTLCHGYVPDRWERERWESRPRWINGAKLLDDQGEGVRSDRLWPPNRLFSFKTFEASRFNDFTDHVSKTVKPRRKVWYWRPWQPECFLYDTVAPVILLDHLDEAGKCLTCGGKQTAKICRCKPVDERPVPSWEPDVPLLEAQS